MILPILVTAILCLSVYVNAATMATNITALSAEPARANVMFTVKPYGEAKGFKLYTNDTLMMKMPFGTNAAFVTADLMDFEPGVRYDLQISLIQLDGSEGPRTQPFLFRIPAAVPTGLRIGAVSTAESGAPGRNRTDITALARLHSAVELQAQESGQDVDVAGITKR